MKKTVLVPLADGFEEIEAVTIIDLLRRADIEVTTAGVQGAIAHGAHGVAVAADAALDDVVGGSFDMLVLPGGEPGATTLRDDPRVQALIKRFAAEDKPIGAICAAPKALAAAGLLDGRNATSYPGYLDKTPAPGMQYHAKPVVQDGKILTSRGPGTAMDFALAIVEQLLGKAARDQVEAPLMRPKAA
jgi:4-methyl-5(b-hydroxyethyl)-thiazole monophosphate biosynthesis